MVKAIGQDAFKGQIELVFQNLDSKSLLNRNVDLSTVKSRFGSVIPFPVNPGSNRVARVRRRGLVRWALSRCAGSYSGFYA